MNRAQSLVLPSHARQAPMNDKMLGPVSKPGVDHGTQTAPETSAYSLSTPGSIMLAWKRMQNSEAPMIQNRVLSGLETQKQQRVS